MIEVTKDDSEVAEEYNYDQEEFDEYEDEDFDSSSGSSDDVKHIKPPSVPTESDRLDLMQVSCVSGIQDISVYYILKVLQAIEAENQQLVVPEVSASPTLYQKSPEDEESPAHKNDESSATPPISSAKLHTSRSLVNFVAAKQQAINRKAAAKTKKRGEVMLLHRVYEELSQWTLWIKGINNSSPLTFLSIWLSSRAVLYHRQWVLKLKLLY